MDDLNSTIIKSSKPKEEPKPTKPNIILRAIPGGMEATLQLQSTGPMTAPPMMEEFLVALKDHGITHGINWDLLEDLCVRPSYFRVFTIAHATPPQKGSDGYVEYLFKMEESRKPTIKHDGTADYKNIDYIRVAEEGQVLCRIYQARQGKSGIDIFGGYLDGYYGREPQNPAGRNTALSFDGTELIAQSSGRVKVSFGIVSVTEILSLDSVDNSTGNVDFKGDVVISGDVAPGFSIKSEGNIVIKGSVEGAILEAGADISVSAGIFGMEKGSISAGGDLRCKFIQNSNVIVSGSIYADSIVFSEVQCKGDLILSGANGALVGGHTFVAGKLEAKTIGNNQYAPTEVNIIATAQDKPTEMVTLDKLIKVLDEEIEGITNTLSRLEELKISGRLSSSQTGQIMDATKRCGECVKQREIASRRLTELQTQRSKSARENSYVECTRTIYPNTTITIGNDSIGVEYEMKNTRVQLTEQGITTGKG